MKTDHTTTLLLSKYTLSFWTYSPYAPIRPKENYSHEALGSGQWKPLGASLLLYFSDWPFLCYTLPLSPLPPHFLFLPFSFNHNKSTWKNSACFLVCSIWSLSSDAEPLLFYNIFSELTPLNHILLLLSWIGAQSTQSLYACILSKSILDRFLYAVIYINIWCYKFCFLLFFIQQCVVEI